MDKPRKRIPENVILELLNDEDFLAMSDADQDEMLSQIEAKFQVMEPSENILQKVAKAATRSIVPGENPLLSGFKTATNAMTSGIPGQSKEYREADEMRTGAIDRMAGGNPLLSFAGNVATDPMTYAGGGKVAKGIGGFARNIANPSKEFGKKIGALQGANPKGKVDFLSIISKSLDDPMAKKVLDKSGVVGKYGGQTMGEGGSVIENLANLTLQDSQDLLNAVKSGVRQAVKEGTVKPTELGIAKMFSELSKAQKLAFPGFEKAKSSYGFAKKVGKASKKYGKAAATGAATAVGLGAGGKVAWDLLN